jgi:hypothetical protein
MATPVSAALPTGEEREKAFKMAEVEMDYRVDLYTRCVDSRAHHFFEIGEFFFVRFSRNVPMVFFCAVQYQGSALARRWLTHCAHPTNCTSH